jgi:hypothetical protein
MCFSRSNSSVMAGNTSPTISAGHYIGRHAEVAASTRLFLAFRGLRTCVHIEDKVTKNNQPTRRRVYGTSEAFSSAFVPPPLEGALS